MCIGGAEVKLHAFLTSAVDGGRVAILSLQQPLFLRKEWPYQLGEAQRLSKVAKKINNLNWIRNPVV
jgi:hypothetical protein